jgi:hypothetical protein
MNTESTSPAEQEALFKARVAMFRVDALSSEVNERFSQLLLAFVAAAIGFFAEKIHSSQANPGQDTLLGVAAILLCVSLLVGAGQLILAHIAALVRSGFSDPDVLTSIMEPLDIPAKLRLLRQVLEETLTTRFWPDSILLRKALEAPDILLGISDALKRLRRMIQYQALFYRLQLLFVSLAAIPVVMAIFA